MVRQIQQLSVAVILVRHRVNLGIQRIDNVIMIVDQRPKQGGIRFVACDRVGACQPGQDAHRVATTLRHAHGIVVEFGWAPEPPRGWLARGRVDQVPVVLSKHTID